MEHVMIQIPVNEPDLSGNEQSYLLDAVTSGWIGMGGYVAEFERRFADFIGTKYALSATSGTAALTKEQIERVADEVREIQKTVRG